MSKLVKGFLAISFVVGGMLLQGCRVNGRVVIGTPRHDYPPQRRWCGVDRWGYRHCDSYRRGPWLVSQAEIMGSDKWVTDDQRVAQVSERYNVSHYAAAYVVNAVVRAEQGDLSGLTTVGLTQQDAEHIYNGGRLDKETLGRVGEKVRMSNRDTEKLLGKIAHVVRAAQ